MALPQLVGAPAYARPTPVVIHTPRPFDPDDLPILATMSEDEPTPGAGDPPRDDVDTTSSPVLRARPFSIRGMVERLRGTGDRGVPPA